MAGSTRDDPDILLVMPPTASGERIGLQVSGRRARLYADVLEARGLVCDVGDETAGGLRTLSVKTGGSADRVADLVRGVEILVQISGRCVFGPIVSAALVDADRAGRSATAAVVEAAFLDVAGGEGALGATGRP